MFVWLLGLVVLAATLANRGVVEIPGGVEKDKAVEDEESGEHVVLLWLLVAPAYAHEGQRSRVVFSFTGW